MYEEENIEPEFLKREKKNPFQTPDHYFDSIEDRVMDTIGQEKRKKTSSGKVLQLLKPIMRVAASLALVYLLAYYPVKYFSQKNVVKSEAVDTISGDLMDSYSLAVSLTDENSLVYVISDDDKTALAEINPDEVLAYLSSDMNDLEIYSEIQN